MMKKIICLIYLAVFYSFIFSKTALSNSLDKEKLISTVKNLEKRVLDLESRLHKSDFDQDGYSPADGDCNDSDFFINPGQLEIPKDEIDNDCNSETSDNQYRVGSTGPAGGFVFYVYNNGLNGMEISPHDLSPQYGAQWGCMGLEINGADGTEIGDGEQNTKDILHDCSDSPTAASIVNDYELNGFSDWFLPSKDEWSAIFPHIPAIGGDWSISIYWTSTETHNFGANNFSVYRGAFSIEDKYGEYGVRAIRDF